MSSKQDEERMRQRQEIDRTSEVSQTTTLNSNPMAPRKGKCDYGSHDEDSMLLFIS